MPYLDSRHHIRIKSSQHTLELEQQLACVIKWFLKLTGYKNCALYFFGKSNQFLGLILHIELFDHLRYLIWSLF